MLLHCSFLHQTLLLCNKCTLLCHPCPIVSPCPIVPPQDMIYQHDSLLWQHNARQTFKLLLCCYFTPVCHINALLYHCNDNFSVSCLRQLSHILGDPSALFWYSQLHCIITCPVVLGQTHLGSFISQSPTMA